MLDESVEKTVNIPYISGGYDFKKICEMSQLVRVGWEINNKTITNKSRPKSYAKKSKGAALETLMEHVMESVYIAQMFLPEKMNIEGYDKHKVICAILYADLGRIQTKDYSPIYSDVRNLNIEEDKKLTYFLMLGALDGYANQLMYFNLVRDRRTRPSDINIQIAYEIKNIQTEYKYYTLYNQLKFSEDRRADFEADFQEPYTEICKDIREMLIFNNPEFQTYL